MLLLLFYQSGFLFWGEEGDEDKEDDTEQNVRTILRCQGTTLYLFLFSFSVGKKAVDGWKSARISEMSKHEAQLLRHPSSYMVTPRVCSLFTSSVRDQITETTSYRTASRRLRPEQNPERLHACHGVDLPCRIMINDASEKHETIHLFIYLF